MTKNPHLDAAVAIFRELGWADATYADAPTLPLGTPEQRKAALAGLRTGQWSGETVDSRGRWAWQDYAGVNNAMLGLFAVRAGVDARRAATLFRPDGSRNTEAPDDVLAAVVAQRGPVFVRTFVERMARSQDLPWQNSHLGALLRLVVEQDLSVPERLPYLEAWTVHAHGAMFDQPWWSDGPAPTTQAEPVGQLVITDVGTERVKVAFFLATKLGLLPARALELVRAGSQIVCGEGTRADMDHLRAEVAALGATAQFRPGRLLPRPTDDPLVASRFADHVRAAVALSVTGTGHPLGRVLPGGVTRGWLDRAEAVELVLAALDTATRPSDRKVWLRVWLDDLVVTDAEIVAHADALVPVLASGYAAAVERLAPVLVAGVDDDLLADVVTAALCAPTTKKARRAILTALAARPRPSTAEVIEPLVTGLEVDQSLARAVTAVVERWGLARPGPAIVQGWWRPAPPVWQVPRFDRGEVSVDAFAEVNAELFRRASATWSGGVHQMVDLATERFLALANELGRRGQGVHLRAALAGGAGTSGAVSWVHGRVTEKRNAYLLEARDQAVFARLGQVPCLLSEPSWVDLRIDPADLLARLRQYAKAGSEVAQADLFLALTRSDISVVEPGLFAELDEVDVPVVLWSGKVAPTPAGPAVRRYLADPYRAPGLQVAPDGTWVRGQQARPASLDEFGIRLGYGPDNCAWLSLFPGWGDAAWGAVCASSHSDLGVALRQAVRRAAPLPPGAAVNLLAAQRSLHPLAASDAGAALVEAWERGLLPPGVADVRYLDWTTHPTAFAANARVLGELAAEGLLAVTWPVLDDLLVAATSASRMPAGTAEVAQTILTLLPEVLAAVTTGTADSVALDLPGIRTLAARSGSSQAVATARQVVTQLPDQVTPIAVRPVEAPDFDMVWPSGAGAGPAVENTEGLTVKNGFVISPWLAPLAGPSWPLPGSPLVASALRDIADDQPAGWRLEKFWAAVRRGRISAATVQVAVRTVLDAEAASPARLARLVDHPQALPVLWPVLTEPVRAAGAGGDPLPRWLNPVLDAAIHHAPTLCEATRRGLIPPETATWPGLSDLAARPGKSAVVTKARTLLAALGLERSGRGK